MLKFPTGGQIKIALDMAGNSGSPPVLFLHGGGQTRHAWGDALNILANEGFFAVTADLRGHGDSDWAEHGGYTLQSFAADVTALCNAFSQLPVIVGASLGGLAALMAVGGSPSPLARGLVLVDVVPRVNMEGANNVRRFMNANADGFESLEEAADAVSNYIPHRRRPSDLSGLRKNLRLRRDGRYYWHWDPKFLNSGELEKGISQLDRAAQAISIPTLLLRGGKSDVVDEDGVNHFRQIMPHAEYAEVDDATHMVAGDNNWQFNRLVLEFLRRHP